MPTFKYYTADVFTDAAFGGNQLAVFPDAGGIPEQRLLDVTREFNYSETVFVYPPADAANTRRVRIFTPGGEIPFAGHPTVGVAYVLAKIGEIRPTGDETRIVLEEGVGPVPVMIRFERGTPTYSQLSVAKLPEMGPDAPDRASLARVLCLDEGDLLEGEWAARGYSCGLPFLYVPLVSLDAVKRAKLRIDAWETSVKGTWAQDIFLFARGGERAGTDIHARMFGPNVNVLEDPATGSACAGLAGYLAARETRRGTLTWRVEQGFEMGRPSMIDVEADLGSSGVTGVRVGGKTVIVCEGQMEIA